MSAPIPCVPCCSVPTTTDIPGTPGLAGTDGADGISSYAFLSLEMNPVPADGGSTGSIAFSGPGTAPTSWMVIGQTLILGQGETNPGLTYTGPFTFIVTAITDSTHATLERVASSTDGTPLRLSAGVTAAPAGYPGVLSGTLPTSLTDNSTGAASNTIAAGVGVVTLVIDHTFIGGTAAVEPITNYTIGFKFKILHWCWVTGLALTGGGGSRVANMEINTTDVGTVPSTITVVQASGAVGQVILGTAVSGANTGSATDTFSIEIASGGTAITAGEGHFIITLQNMDTADAVASLADHINDLITALT